MTAHPNGAPLPAEDVDEISKLVTGFFEAVQRVDGEAVWDSLSEVARAWVLNLAIERGLDFDLASRIRQESASAEERAEYVSNLAEGIRYDLRGVELDKVVLELRPEPETPDVIRVTYLIEVGAGTAFDQRIPAGSLTVTREQDVGWRVVKLYPKPG